MVDPRIAEYRRAALEMASGAFHIEVPLGSAGDEVARLGMALVGLSETLEKRFAELNELGTITQQVNAGLMLDEVLDHVYDTFRSLIPYDRIGFSLLEDEGTVVRARWARSEAPEMRITSGYSAPLEGSSLRQIIATGQPRILNDLEAYQRDHPDSHSTRLIVKEGMRSSLTCPLVALNRPVGFMFFSSMQAHTYADVHVELFLQIAGQLAVIVEKSRLYQQLVELNELKTKFLGMAAHDLRSPLGVVIGYLELLMEEEEGEVPEPQVEILQNVDRVCRGMLALINDLLDLSAIESGHLELRCEELDLADYLRECHASNAMLAQNKDIALTLDLAPDLPRVSLDPHRIGQVVYNLVANAIKFSHRGSTIALRATRTRDTVTVAVADQGQGIPQEELPRLFAEFSRTSVRPTGGEQSTGLGLAIVKRIVDAHQGRVWVESDQGSGSTFSFALPLGGS